MGNYGMKQATLHTKGFTLIASLLLLLLLSGMAIGLMMMVNTEGKVGATDLQNNLAYHAAEGGIEQMYANLSEVIQNVQVPTAAQICSAGAPTNPGPSMMGISWTQYSVVPGSTLTSSCPSSLSGLSNWATISSGPNQGLYAQVIPVSMIASASMVGGQEVTMTRSAQIALIPVFQFGMFCDADCSIFPGSNMTFAGPVHANGDFYPFVGNGSTLTFENKVAAYGNIIRTQLPNTSTTGATDHNGTVNVPTASPGCGAPVPPSTSLSNCTQMAQVGTDSGDGSVTGGGSSTAQPTANINSYWSNFSETTTAYEVINGNYFYTGATTPAGTGAKKLSMPFVDGTNFPYEILRRPPTGESASSALGSSREYNMAQIRVLLSDDPAEFANGTGASDSNNVRLANVAQGTGNTYVSQWGVIIPSGSYPSSLAPGGTNNFTLYFASASNGVPIPANCSATSATCTSDDWPSPPLTWTAAMASAAGVYFWPPVPATAPLYWNYGPAPTVNLCPPAGVTSASTPTPTLNCAYSTVPTPTATTTNTWGGDWGGVAGNTYPYYAPPNPALPAVGSALTTYNQIYSTGGTSTAGSDSWSLLDGWLRVEYLSSSGSWVPVTNEWLQLGFARGTTPPTANWAGAPATGTKNPINSTAILILQQPADRSTAYTLAPEPALTGAPSTGTAPTCSAWNAGHTICTNWTPGVPPQLASDAGSGGEWAFGITPAAPSATTPQSLTEYNWYPINFYDAREGEPRDKNWNSYASDNSCTTNGVMNAVEIDVGNLQQWLLGNIGTSGKSVNSSTQNGYILYFSDRRGMLPSPNVVSSHPANTKTGDSGLEDTINSSSVNGVPDGVLQTKMTGQTVSPEDDNGNGVLDNWGAYNLGMGFYGTVSTAGQNLNTLISSTNPKPNPYGSDAGGDNNNRIQYCGRTARKNWVSGARHVLKLVDGSLGNLPLNPNPITYNGKTYNGGFTVASENPVYLQGDYNSSAADTVWTKGTDSAGMAAAAVIADTVTLLSDSWDDRISMLGASPTQCDGTPGDTSPSNYQNREVCKSGYYRVAIAAGKNMTFTYPTAAWPGLATDTGTDGGIHNFLHLLEDWGTDNPTENYMGSLASLYYSTYNTGFYKCCTAVYGVPTRNFSFDLDFESPYGLPPGTPMFKDVESLSYRQMLTPRGINGN